MLGLVHTTLGVHFISVPCKELGCKFIKGGFFFAYFYVYVYVCAQAHTGVHECGGKSTSKGIIPFTF